MTADLAALRAAVEAATAALAEAETASSPTTASTAGGVEVTTPSFADRGIEDKPKAQTVEDALDWIRRKHGKTRSEALAASGDTSRATATSMTDSTLGTSAADGRAEALRRIARRP